MENIENIVVENEDTMENVMEEMVPATSGNGLKVAGGIGLAALVGLGVYKSVKFIRAKAKAKKEEKEESFEDEAMVDEEDVVEDAVD